jgi:DNA (cytosine-5)-methyltransferase 1
MNIESKGRRKGVKQMAGSRKDLLNVKAQMSMTEEISVVNFAGGGGSDDGIERYTTIMVGAAINHDPAAILMHKTNHPFTEHLQEDVFAVDPVEVCRGRPVGLAWFSPDCTHFSRAKGGTPVKKEIRGLSWVIVRWAITVRPRVILMENVKEIRTWGPLIERDDGLYPDPAHKGETFEGFVQIMTTGIEPGHPALLECCEFLRISPDGEEAQKLIRGLGYDMDWREMCAADFGVPTIRERFFGAFRCDGQPIRWPEPTHAKRDSAEVMAGKKLPWVGAHTVIDWTLPAPSIFASKRAIKEEYGVNAVRPLAENTMRRIARGLDKFVLKAERPFIVPIGYGERVGQPPRVQSVDEPMSTIVSGTKQYVCDPVMAQYIVEVNHAGDFRGQDITDPLNTITAKHGRGVVNTIMAPFTATNTSNAVGTSVDDPVNTVRTGGGCGQMLVTPVMACIGQTGGGDRIGDVRFPVPTIVWKAEVCIATPYLTQYHQEQGEDVRGQAVDYPIMTIDGSNRYGVGMPYLAKYYGNDEYGQAIGEPLHTVTARDREGLVVASISKFFGGGYEGSGADVSDPLPTVTAVDHNAVQLAHICKFKGQDIGQHPETPLHTITATAGEFAIIKSKVMRYVPGADVGHWPQVRAMLNTWCGYELADDEILLQQIRGEWWFICDIGLRMLIAREAFSAMGFAPDYIIDRDYLGNPYPKTEQMRRCGNAVCPPLAGLLAAANLPEYARAKPLAMLDTWKQEVAV